MTASLLIAVMILAMDMFEHDGILSIKAQRSAESEEGERGSKFYRRERSWGAVSRRIALPGIVKDAPWTQS